jgi:hypothetical protein
MASAKCEVGAGRDPFHDSLKTESHITACAELSALWLPDTSRQLPALSYEGQLNYCSCELTAARAREAPRRKTCSVAVT